MEIKQIFSLDKRALGVARILFGIILIYDLFKRFDYITFHYGANSVLPPDLLFSEYLPDGRFTFHFLVEQEWWLYSLFLIKLFCYTFLLVGYRTRIFTLLTWFLLVSLHNANPLLLNSGDVYLRLILFWAIFLPWGDFYSIDSLKKSNSSPTSFFSLASTAFILQICFVYLFTGLLKSSPEWLYEGTALYYALSLDQLAKPIGQWILQFPVLLKIGTFSTLFFEFIAPFLILSPIYNHYTRFAAIALLTALHLGIWISMMVGLFSPICIAALLALTPGYFIDLFDKKRIKSTILQEDEEKNPYLDLVKKSILTFSLVMVFVWNLKSVIPKISIPTPLSFISNTLHINQSWRMFAPSVAKDDGWFIFEAKTIDNETFDLFQTDNVIYYEYPEYNLALFKNNARWRKFFENMYRRDNPELYDSVINSFLYHHNESESVKSVTVYYRLIRTQFPGYEPHREIKERHKKIVTQQ